MIRRIFTIVAAGLMVVPLAACDFTATGTLECRTEANGNIVCSGEGTGVPNTPTPPTTTEPTTPPTTTPPTTPAPIPTTEPPEPSEPPTTEQPPPTTGAPQPDVLSAAERFNWGTPRWADEFNYTGRPDPAVWSLPGASCWAGHAGKGRRCAENSVVGDGVLTQTGEPNGDTAWMQSRQSWYQGRIETRVRVVDTPGRDNEYHPVLLMWPAAEDFPVGGEIDYAEATATSDNIDFFLHYGAENRQTHGEKQVNLLDWNNYAFEWNAECITGFVNGEQFFQDCNRGHLPPRAMDTAIQLDYFPDGSAGPGETRMQVDWTRSYAL